MVSSCRSVCTFSVLLNFEDLRSLGVYLPPTSEVLLTSSFPLAPLNAGLDLVELGVVGVERDDDNLPCLTRIGFFSHFLHTQADKYTTMALNSYY